MFPGPLPRLAGCTAEDAGEPGEDGPEDWEMRIVESPGPRTGAGGPSEPGGARPTTRTRWLGRADLRTSSCVRRSQNSGVTPGTPTIRRSSRLVTASGLRYLGSRARSAALRLGQ